MQQYYQKVAEKFPQPNDIRVFWDSLAQQESIHATIISTLTNMFRNNPEMFSEIVEVDYSTILKMENFILTSEEKLESTDFTLDDALNEAFELETLEINEIYDRIIESPKEPFRAVIDHLIESEEAHLNSLIEAIMKYSSKDSLKEKAQNLKSAFLISPQV
ncbi:hypothetical protein IH922_02620 [candidate division KSB1 bacterium]|nr:hypothetical protein [candidate division KSB1 bacterium]